MAAGRQYQCEESQRRAAGGEDVNRKSADLRKTHRYWLPQSSLTISAERPARFQLRPKPRKRDLSARETMTSGPIQYSLLRISTFWPASLPRTGVMAPPPYLSRLIIRVSPLVS